MIKAEKTYLEKTVNRVYDLINFDSFDSFPIKVEIGNLIGVDHLELLSETSCLLSREKYKKRLSEQREILASLGMVDDASANAYMDKLEPQLEAWAKQKQVFDEETEARLKLLQAEFLSQLPQAPAQFPSAEA